MRFIKCLLLMLVLLTLSAAALAEQQTVYVMDGSAGDGSSPEQAVGTLAEAFAALPEGGRVVVCGRVDAGGEVLPATSGLVIVTAVDDSRDHRGEGCGLYISGILELNGETTFEHLQIIAAEKNSLIICNGHRVVLGEGLACTKKGSTNYIGVNGGSNLVKTSPAEAGTGSTDLTIMSGTWAQIRGGNRRQVGGSATHRIIQGDTKLTITGGEFTDLVFGGGQNSQDGDILLNISGGTFRKGVYGVCRLGTNEFNGIHNGNVAINVTGGSFEANIGAVYMDSPATEVYGMLTVHLSGAELGPAVVVTGSELIPGSSHSVLRADGTQYSDKTLYYRTFHSVVYTDGVPGEIQSLRIPEGNMLVVRGEKYAFTSELTGTGKVVWSVDSMQSSVNEAGMLTVSQAEEKPMLTLTAALADDPTVKASVRLTLAQAAQINGQEAVYVRDGGQGDGSSASLPLGSISDAMATLKDGGMVVICGPVSVTQPLNTPEIAQRITITSVADGVDYRETRYAALSVGAYISLGGPITIEELDIRVKQSNLLITCNGHETIIGEGVSCTRDGASNYIGVTAGVNVVDAASPDVSSTSLTIMSGDWQIIRGGNRRGAQGEATMRTIQGDIALNITGGSFWGVVSGGGQNSQKGDIRMSISGGSFQKGIYGLCDPGSDAVCGTVNGDVALTISGGEFGGNIAASANAEKTALNGTFAVDIAGGNFLKTVAITGTQGTDMPLAGENTSSFAVDEETMMTYAGEHRVTFQNPIMSGADPSITFYDGMYYMLKAGGVGGEYVLNMYKATTLAGLSNAQGSIVWKPENGHPWSEELWSPKLYRLDDAWYIYVACDDGLNINHRVYVLKAVTDDPMGEYEFLGALQGDKLPDLWAIGPHIAELNGVRYYFFTGRDEANTEQYLYAAKMASPTQLATTPVIICKPDYEWEMRGSSESLPKVVEGATPLVAPDGTIHIIYSASGSWCDEYCLGKMTLRAGGNVLDPADWCKAPEPVLTKYIDEETPANSVYGPGHAAFTQVINDAGETEDWIVYHGQLGSGSGWSGRSILAQPFEWDENGHPVFFEPDLTSTYAFTVQADSLMEIVSGFEN